MHKFSAAPHPLGGVCGGSGDKGGGEEKLEEEADKGVSQSAVPIPVLKIFIEIYNYLSEEIGRG